MTDNYEFMKSKEQQSLDDQTPFASKDFLFINDLNNGVYNNLNTTLVQFNCQSIYNSSKFISNDMFLLIPITMMYGIYGTQSLSGNPIVKNQGFMNLYTNSTNEDFPWQQMMSLKNDNLNLIHNAEIIVDDTTLQAQIPYVNISQHFQLLSRMSDNDLFKYGRSLGIEKLDNTKSVRFNASSLYLTELLTQPLGREGNGFVNNRIFNDNVSNASNENQIYYSGNLNDQCINGSRLIKSDKYYNKSGTKNFNKLFGDDPACLVKDTDLMKNYQPSISLVSVPKDTGGGQLVYYNDFVVIRLKDLFNSIDQMPLLKRFNAKINIYFNTGVCSVNVNSTTVNTSATTKVVNDNLSYYFNGQKSTFSNTLPYVINYIPKFPYIPSTSTVGYSGTIENYKIISGLFIKNPPSSFSIDNVLVDNSAFTQQNLSSCRLYYSQQLLHPEKSIKYLEENRNKRLVFRDVIYNQDSNIAAGSSYSKLINSGIKNAEGLLIIPLIAKTSLSALPKYFEFNFNQFGSPLDTCPATFCCLSLLNVNANLGGNNVLQNHIDYNFEQFLTQLSLVDTISSADFGVTNGLINQDYWEKLFRCYYLNLSRGNEADQGISRSLSVSFINNSNCAIDVLYFIFYKKEFNLDVMTGMIQAV